MLLLLLLFLIALIFGFAALGIANLLNERGFVLLSQVFIFVGGEGEDVEKQKVI